MVRVIGKRYRPLRKIGDGGFGEVWLARDLWLRRDVAAKCVFARDENGTARRRIFREARIAANLHHPYIVAVFDLVDEDVPWLIMEYVHGGRNLADLPESATAADIAGLGAQIADALAATHAAEIVHGDVKPRNVLLTPDTQVKLTDFGLSRGVRPGLSMTDNGLVYGTPGYMAPEVANGGKPTMASDVFSLGATLFAAAAGVSPYGDNGSDLATIRRAQDYQLLPCARAGELADVIGPMLARDPASRPDAATASRALYAAATHLDPTGALPRRPPGNGTSPARQRRRWLVPALSAAGVAAVLAAVLPFVPWSTGGGRPATETARAASPVGDPRTADPCSIADPAALNQFGHTQLSEDQGNFDRCDVIVSPPGGDNIDVELQFLTGAEVPDPPPRATTTAAGHIRIVRMPEDDGRCMRYLLLPDGYAVVVDPKTNGNLNLCPMANAAVPPAVAELRKGTLPRRSLPASSLARRDTCALLDSAALTRAVNAVGDRHQAGFGNWTCRWSSLTSDLSVMLRYDQGDPGSENDGQPEKLSGRDAYVSPGGDGNDGCLVRIVNRTFTDSGGSPAEEVVYLVVNGNRPPTELCAPANTLAANAAANLQRR